MSTKKSLKIIFITFHTDHFWVICKTFQSRYSRTFFFFFGVSSLFLLPQFCSLGNVEKQSSSPFKNTRGPASALLLAKGWKVLILDSGKQERGGGVYQKWPKCDPSKQTSSTSTVALKVAKKMGKKLIGIYETHL